jgi:hypothetical protein
VSLGLYSDLVENNSGPGHFNNTVSADLDGDGKQETITLTGGKPYAGVADQNPSYSDITVDIDGSKLNLKNGDDLPFTLFGKIIDTDKNNGKKEILIEASILIGGTTDYIISYDDKKPLKIFEGELYYPDYTIGAGYIMTRESYLTNRERLYYYELRKIKNDRCGFEPAGNEYYPTLFQQYCWDKSGNWDVNKATPAKWDQDLFKEPDGNEKVSVKKGTPVFIGLYAKKNRLMILDDKGELLGWLDTDSVDFGEYTNHAFEPEGD